MGEERHILFDECARDHRITTDRSPINISFPFQADFRTFLDPSGKCMKDCGLVIVKCSVSCISINVQKATAKERRVVGKCTEIPNVSTLIFSLLFEVLLRCHEDRGETTRVCVLGGYSPFQHLMVP